MSSSLIAVERRHTFGLARVGDYAALTKPKISALVLATVAASGFVASWGQPDPLVLLHAVIGTALVAASGSAMNQWLERGRDALMSRTAERPLPAGRMSGREAVVVGTVTVVIGLLYLGFAVTWRTAGVALVTWLAYVWVYTPLKTKTTWNTTIGAVAGALPVMIGWTAVGADLDLRALSLLLIVFLWQFPHFMAIAWIYRDQYSRAGMKMSTAVDTTGRCAGLQAVAASLALLPVSFLPAMYTGPASTPYLVAALLLGTGQLAFSLLFLFQTGTIAAKRLFQVTLVYLPTLLIGMMFIPLM